MSNFRADSSLEDAIRSVRQNSTRNDSRHGTQTQFSDVDLPNSNNSTANAGVRRSLENSGGALGLGVEVRAECLESREDEDWVERWAAGRGILRGKATGGRKGGDGSRKRSITVN